jgi:Uma2 family endonuclease
MIETGILTEADKVELLGGVIVEQMTKNPPHNFTVDLLASLLRPLVAPDWIVREEKSVVLGRNWRPEPDIAVIRGPNDRYRMVDPTAADVALIVEVSESSGGVDRGEKLRGYAAARVPAYWPVDLGRRVVEVYSDPGGRGKAARYRATAVSAPGGEVTVAVGGREAGRVSVNEIFL